MHSLYKQQLGIFYKKVLNIFEFYKTYYIKYKEHKQSNIFSHDLCFVLI